jgi:hypothetical protein
MCFWGYLSTAAALVLVGAAAVSAAPAASGRHVTKAAVDNRPVRLDNIADWNSFITEFRRAVERRDRRALRACMDSHFRYTFDRTPGGDPRDEALELWDRSGDRIWVGLERVLLQGNRNDPEVPGLMVSPPAWVDDNRYIGYRAGFMKIDGSWRWIWYVSGDY